MVRRDVQRIVTEHRHIINEAIRAAAPDGTLLYGRGAALRDTIKRELEDLTRDVHERITLAQTEAWTQGTTLGRDTAVQIFGAGTFNTPGFEVLAYSQRFTAKLVKSIAAEAMPEIELLISQVSTGALSMWEAMQKVDKVVGWNGEGGVSYRAERIVRTETLRISSLATDTQLHSIAKAVSPSARAKLRKTWIAGAWRQGRRPGHQWMDKQTVGWDEPFITGDGNLLLYPRDPAGGAGETINCMCSFEPDADSIEAAIAASDIAA